MRKLLGVLQLERREKLAPVLSVDTFPQFSFGALVEKGPQTKFSSVLRVVRGDRREENRGKDAFELGVIAVAVVQKLGKARLDRLDSSKSTEGGTQKEKPNGGKVIWKCSVVSSDR